MAGWGAFCGFSVVLVARAFSQDLRRCSISVAGYCSSLSTLCFSGCSPYGDSHCGDLSTCYNSSWVRLKTDPAQLFLLCDPHLVRGKYSSIFPTGNLWDLGLILMLPLPPCCHRPLELLQVGCDPSPLSSPLPRKCSSFSKRHSFEAPYHITWD